MHSMTNISDASLSPSPDPKNILMIGSGELDATRAFTELHMPGGQVIRIATALLQPEIADRWTVIDVQDELLSAEPDALTIPLIAERAEISTCTVQTGKVRLQKTVEEYEEELNEPLALHTFQIERIALNQVVEDAPAVRQEGDTTIYSVVEEQLILTKQLILKEEVRVTRQESERLDTQVVTLRRERLSVERSPV